MKLYSFILLLWIMLSCGPTDWKTSTDSILFNYRWITYYADEQGRYLSHHLEFHSWGEGRENILNGMDEVSASFFKWYWLDNGSSILFEYENGEIKYFDKVRLTNNTLSGVLDGKNLIFDGH